MFIILGIFLGTYGLAWMHFLVHKYDMWRSSVVWSHHLLHHSKLVDLEFVQRRKYDIITYSAVRTFNYIKDFRNWGYMDYLAILIAVAEPGLLISYLVGIFISENIGYLQHDYSGQAVDFTNRFDNFISLNAGHHSKHHGHTTKHRVETQIFIGLFAMYCWWIIVAIIYVPMRFNPKRSNLKGVYKFDILTNLANYREANGTDISKLIYRSTSIFDKPKILGQYVQMIFGRTPVAEKPYLSHDISNIRNIYLFTSEIVDTKDVVWYEGKIVEGHHRYEASLLNRCNTKG